MKDKYECDGQISLFEWAEERRARLRQYIPEMCGECARFFPNRKEQCIVYGCPKEGCGYYRRRS